MLYRKPATLRRMRGERKILELACFLLSPVSTNGTDLRL